MELCNTFKSMTSSPRVRTKETIWYWYLADDGLDVYQLESLRSCLDVGGGGIGGTGVTSVLAG